MYFIYVLIKDVIYHTHLLVSDWENELLSKSEGFHQHLHLHLKNKQRQIPTLSMDLLDAFIH